MKFLFLFLSILFAISCTDSSVDTKSCSNQCDEKGIFCSEDSLYDCSIDSNGCFVKLIIKKCGENEVCENSQCINNNCEDDCIESGFYCPKNSENKKLRYECGNFDSDFCLDKKEVFCNEGEHCEMGECVPDCVPSEEVCDGQDNNCDGVIDENFPDYDEDKLANCIDDDDDNDGSLDTEDCAPLNEAVYPSADELCDGIDNNCNDIIDEAYVDTDNDNQANCVDQDDDNDGSPDIEDCAPLNESIHPNADELCDGVDNNCNNSIDEGFIDTDNDNQANCVDEDDDNDGSLDTEDCAPLNEAIHPNATELCDGIDNNCNTTIDEGFIDTDNDNQANCVDNDDDNDGSLDLDDCKPLDSAIYPGATEICDGLDNNCDNNIDEGYPDTDNDNQANCVDEDDDNDGSLDINDCKPLNANIHPNAEEKCNGLDDDCSSVIDDNLVYPNSDIQFGVCEDMKKVCNGTELWGEPDYSSILTYQVDENLCDGLDNDCDDEIDEGHPDTDNDATLDCLDNCPRAFNAGQVNSDNDDMGDACDCYPNDENIEIQEICDGVDNNCNGLVDEGDICNNVSNCTNHIYNNHSYLFCTNNKNWQEAREFCNENNYNLATIESLNENNWIHGKIVAYSWIGLNDTRVEDDFNWESGSDSGFTVWNSTSPASSDTRDCVQILSNGTWNNIGCNNNRDFICERSLSPEPVTATLSKSCKEILDNDASSGSGIYYINKGTSLELRPILVYCDMTTDGGGWTLVASWFYDYNWTLGNSSSSEFFGPISRNTVSSNFGDMQINDFRITAAKSLDNIINNNNVLADWYYHYNNALSWKEVWAPNAHSGTNSNDCSNGYISDNSSAERQALKMFNYSYNILFDYQNSNHNWNNISDWGANFSSDGNTNCDNIANYWEALTVSGVDFGVNNYQSGGSSGDGSLGIFIDAYSPSKTGQDIEGSYSALVGYDDNNKHASYGDSADDISTNGNNSGNIESSTKLWWWVR